MNQPFGLSWDHGKRKLAAAIALLLIAVTLAVTPAASSIEAGKKGVAADPTPISYTVMGSTWG